MMPPYFSGAGAGGGPGGGPGIGAGAGGAGAGAGGAGAGAGAGLAQPPKIKALTNTITNGIKRNLFIITYSLIRFFVC